MTFISQTDAVLDCFLSSSHRSSLPTFGRLLLSILCHRDLYNQISPPKAMNTKPPFLDFAFLLAISESSDDRHFLKKVNSTASSPLYAWSVRKYGPSLIFPRMETGVTSLV